MARLPEIFINLLLKFGMFRNRTRDQPCSVTKCNNLKHSLKRLMREHVLMLIKSYIFVTLAVSRLFSWHATILHCNAG